MTMKELDVEHLEKLLLPIKDCLKNLATKQSLLNLPTKADLNSELQQLFESVTIHVGEELAKRDKKFTAELKLRDERIDKLEAQIQELCQNNKSAPETEHSRQTTYAPELFSTVENSQKENVDLCLIGDSIVKHIDLEKINPGSINKKLCTPGGKIENAREQLKSVSLNNNVKKLIFCTGTNHIPQEKPLDVAKKLINLIRDAKHNLPDSQIFVSAILPKYGKSYARGINIINRTLFQASKLYKFDLIFNLQFQVNGAQNDALYGMDELHLNRRGVARLAKNFKYRLKKLSTSV